MKGFKFKLGRLARVRKIQEELARAQWQAAEQAASEARRRVEHGGEAIDQSIAELRRLQSDVNLDPRLILQARDAIEHLEERLVALERLAVVAQEESARLREPWQVLRAELEGLKRLEEKEHTKFRVEGEREEAKQIDEQAQDRFRRPNTLLRRESA